MINASVLASSCIALISYAMFLLERQGAELRWACARYVLTVDGPGVCGRTGAPMVVAIAALLAAHMLSYVLRYVLTIPTAGQTAATFSSTSAVPARNFVLSTA